MRGEFRLNGEYGSQKRFRFHREHRNGTKQILNVRGKPGAHVIFLGRSF
jgi:hypothetical protein